MWCPYAFIRKTLPLTGSLAVALWDGIAVLRSGGNEWMSESWTMKFPG